MEEGRGIRRRVGEVESFGGLVEVERPVEGSEQAKETRREELVSKGGKGRTR